MLESAKTPFGSYKKDNGDLRPEDRPWIAVITNKGKYFHWQLSVVDRQTSLTGWKTNFDGPSSELYWTLSGWKANFAGPFSETSRTLARGLA